MSAQATYWNTAIAELSAADATLARLIQYYPQGRLSSRGDAFETLARAIAGQQISVKAAESIWQRLIATANPTPPDLANLSIEEIRLCGFSYKKAGYLHDLARHFNEGLLDEKRFAQMDDEHIIRTLTEVRGIGRWSAEMFLMFHLLRPDVLPLADIGLQKAMILQYPHLANMKLAALREQAEMWRPWRSVATWYLWRSLDPHEITY
ncbi:MAG: DNA-3-methyladenine glycosylase 2 family protein [Betaproteobacteria bacterium]|nr:DNA-3-methyladenine glycosylase 2 family protein [Betaproteobacteria bacterium]